MMHVTLNRNSVGFLVLSVAAIGFVAGCAPAGGGNGNENAAENTNDNTGTGAPTWQTVVEIDNAALLAISGTTSSDVYAVGADPGDGQGSLFLHYDGTAWSRLSSQTTDTLWWISEAPVDGIYFLSGDNGRIVEFDPANAAEPITPHVTPSDTLRVFGTWGPTRDDQWAVLSDESIGSTGGEIWHYDGNANNEWTIYDFSEQFPGGFPGLIKIWGRSASEIYAVGGQGAVFQYDGTDWSQLNDLDGTTAEGRVLLSVHGNSESVGFSGGFLDGVLAEKNSPLTTFAPIATILPFQVNGVFYREDFAVGVGIDLSVSFRENGVWTLLTNTGFNAPDLNFHGPWIDPDGGVWAVGGQLDIEPLTDGILTYYGSETVATGSF